MGFSQAFTSLHHQGVRQTTFRAFKTWSNIDHRAGFIEIKQTTLCSNLTSYDN
jgi:hypothetical protein